MLIGKRISGRYRLEQHIGGGGMSNVYSAHDMILDREVAVKILRYDFSNEEDLHRRFQREALSVTSLTHENIVTIYDVGEDEDIHYIVMEHVKGKTLKEYIAEHAPVSPNRTVQIMKQLTSAIEHAHDHHIIHRDIKPQNILMDEEGNVKVTDFGIAMALSATSFTQTNSVLGTVHYLSPEQARGGTATRKSDIYALGIVLYELLTGQLPFKGESAVSIALKHLQAETPSVRAINPEIPQSLENVVFKATAKKQEDRYTTVKEMYEHISDSLNPDRMNEEKYAPRVDHDATKVLPIIKEPMLVEDLASTKKMQPTAPATVLPEEQPKKKKRKVGLIIAAVIGAIIFLGLLLIVIFPGLFKPAKVEVPDLIGLTVEQATEEIEANGFLVGDIREEFSEDVEEGLVIRSTPEEGRLRDPETEISLFVSLGDELAEMSDYTGRDIEQVLALLSNQPFNSIETVEEFSDEPVGTILEQNPAAGEEVDVIETDLVFTVSKGPDLVAVLDLTGYNDRALEAYERTSGFSITIRSTESSNEVPEGEVLRQDPSSGTRLEPGSEIAVVMSSGPAATAVKLYVVSVEIPYVEEEVPTEPEQPQEPQDPTEDPAEDPVEDPVEEEPTPQIVKIFVQDKTRTLAEPIEEFELTETATRRLQLEIEEGTQGAYRIEVNNVVIEQQTINFEDLP